MRGRCPYVPDYSSVVLRSTADSFKQGRERSKQAAEVELGILSSPELQTRGDVLAVVGV